MLIIKEGIYLYRILTGFVSVFILTGCPGIGDRIQPSEETRVSMQADSICFWVSDVKDMEVAHIAINPRETPFRQQSVIFSPDLKLLDGQLCLPPSFYDFPSEGKFIVEYILASKEKNTLPRIVITRIEINAGHVNSIPLFTDEIR